MSQCSPYLFVIKCCPIWFISKNIFENVSGHLFKNSRLNQIRQLDASLHQPQQTNSCIYVYGRNFFWTNYRNFWVDLRTKRTCISLNSVKTRTSSVSGFYARFIISIQLAPPRTNTLGSLINHVVKFLGSFDPSSPSWSFY